MGKAKLPPGTWVEKALLQSQAFLCLRGFAPQLLIIILWKRQFKTVGPKGAGKRICINSDSINITYSEFYNKYGITQPRLTKAIDHLLAKGFLTRIHAGGCYKRDKAVFALSDKWMSWRPGTVFEEREKYKVHRGFCKPKRKNQHTKP